MISCADWIIDLSPDGGDKGGEIVVVGTPETVAELPPAILAGIPQAGVGAAPPEVLAG